MEINKSQKPQN